MSRSQLGSLLLALCGAMWAIEGTSAADCPSKVDSPAPMRLKSSLFCNYDHYTRPVKQRSSTVTVNISLDLKYLSIDEYNSHMTLHSWVVTTWKDENLSWDAKQYENITYLIVPSDDIWLPDLSIYNSDLTQIMLFSSTTCVLYNTGVIKCAPDLRTPVYCDQNLYRWPYDVQNCSLYIGSWAHAGEEIDVKLQDGKGYRKYLFTESNAWELVSIAGLRHSAMYCCPNASYPHLVYHFELKRHAAMYAASIVVPAFVLAGVTLTSFWVRGMASRACVCCSALLGDALFLQYIGYHLPADGDSCPSIVSFYRDAMVLCVVSLVVALGVERSRQPDDDGLRPGSSSCVAPRWLTGGAAWLRGRGGRAGQLLLGEGDAEGQTPSTDKEEEGPPQCRVFATLLDRTAFLAVLITYAILLLALLP